MQLVDAPLRVLLVEDDEDDYLITREMLAGQDRARFSVDWCSDFNQGLVTIREQRHDVYLIDYHLGPHTGLDLVRDGFVQRPFAPVIMLTGETDYQIDLEATSLGVTDFLVKQELDPTALERSIRYAVSQHRAVSELTLSEERYALAVRAANDGIWDWDLIADKLYLSPRWHAILGREERPEPEDPSVWFELIHGDDLLRLRAAIDAHVAGRTPHLESEHRVRHADGSWRWVVTRGLAIRDQTGTAVRMAGSMSDITDRRSAEHKLQHDAFHDSLTGLPNRALFVDRVDQVLQRGLRENETRCAILFLDIDRFKLVNDSLSHGVGDHLLIALAGRLASVLRPGDTVARIGGDEFTLLLDGVVTEQSAAMVAERVQSSLAQPFNIDDHQLFVTASIGISLSTPRMTAAELLRNADIAMYDAKRRGRARYALFDESMHRRVVDRLARENELRDAVERSLMPIHYQPIIDLATGAICAFEALVRWPVGWTEVSPLDFIPIAEETGMIGALGLHVLRTALSELAAWRAADLVSDDVYMSVNVSGRQLEEPNLPSQVSAAVAGAGVPPSALRLEITESTLMQEPEAIQRIVSDVCAAGVGLHLDDFGTGYSSLAALHQFPVDALKIDRSFVAALGRDGTENDVIVRSTIALAHSLGLHVIAEGIEHQGQLRRLRTLGCEYGQGFLFSRPLDAAQTRQLLSSWSPADVAMLGDHVA
ncbi:MAG TPA: EAL domain-containing protein [Solirubrobacteraceae bacterium]|jgi:diguanylate cyclase (GGDEF)-like protein/PAS domain S-box-containing protein